MLNITITLQPTPATHCFFCDPSFVCNPNPFPQAAAPGVVHQTLATVCTQFQPQCPGQVGLNITAVNCPTIPPYPGCYTFPPRCNTFLMNCNFA